MIEILPYLWVVFAVAVFWIALQRYLSDEG
jgi:hypothetical protein